MKELKPNRITRTIVNDALRAHGRDESLREGNGYFYFGGGEAVNWLSTSVMARRLSDLTLDQWMAELDKLLDRDNNLRAEMDKERPKDKAKHSRK